MLNIIFVIMIDYRAYIIDGAGNILFREDVEANNDTAAITAGWKIFALYNALPLAHGVELWDARRRVFSTHPRG